jgi:myo-inositol catabolism protein IolS
MSKIIIGTWQTVPSDGFWTNQDPALSEKLLGFTIRQGFSCFDTAQGYGKGRAEQLLGKVLSRYPNKEFYVDSKLMPSSKEPLELVSQSLARLRIKKLNRLYLHWPKTGFDVKGFLHRMLTLKDAGLVNKVGICNTPLEYLKNLETPLDCLQLPVSLLWTRDLKETLSYCREQKIEVVAYSPLGMGLLSGKYTTSSDLTDARASLFCFKDPCYKPFLNLLGLLKEIACERGVSPAAVALAWVTKSGVDNIILGIRSKEQLLNNVEALNFALNCGELEALNKAAYNLDQESRKICNNLFSYNW